MCVDLKRGLRVGLVTCVVPATLSTLRWGAQSWARLGVARLTRALQEACHSIALHCKSVGALDAVRGVQNNPVQNACQWGVCQGMIDVGVIQGVVASRHVMAKAGQKVVRPRDREDEGG